MHMKLCKTITGIVFVYDRERRSTPYIDHLVRNDKLGRKIKQLQSVTGRIRNYRYSGAAIVKVSKVGIQLYVNGRCPWRTRCNVQPQNVHTTDSHVDLHHSARVQAHNR